MGMQKKGSVLSRRQFLARSAGAAAGAVAFPYIIPGSALGLDGAVAPSNRITMASIGVGGMGTGNLNAFLDLKGAQVLAVCDVDTEHRENAAKAVNGKYGNQDCALYNDFREVLARKDIDAVSLALPDHWHGIIGVWAARAGKDIYGEKPLAYNISEGRAVVDAVHRYGRVWQTGSWQRSVENFRTACELVRNGRIGKVHTVKVGLPDKNGIHKGSTAPSDPPPGFDYDMWLGPAPWAPYCEARCHWNFRWHSDYAGGQLTDWAGHHIDIAHWGMDTEMSAPVEIEGRGQWPTANDGLFDTPENYTFTCQYREGFTMIVSALLPGGTRFEGENGQWIHVNRGSIDANPKSLLKEQIGPDEIHLIKSDSHHANFLDCVRTRAKTITPAEAAHHSVMVAHLGMAAMKTERKLKFDPETERFVNDDDANRMLSRAMRSPWHL
jgi:predicted dehydrogenase